jgi:hypothetical protein
MRAVVPSILISVICAVTAAQSTSPCQSDESQKSSIATFVCTFNADVMLSSSCATEVTETLLFPHTTGENAYRVVAYSERTQGIFNVAVTRGGAPVEVALLRKESNELNISIPTRKESSPVEFVIKYLVSNGITKFSKSCANGVSADASLDVVHWRPGSWDKDLRELVVTFRSMAPRNLSVVGDLPFGSNVARVPGGVRVVLGAKDKAATNDVDVYVTSPRLAAGQCEAVAGCVGNRTHSAGIEILAATLVVVGIIVCVCIGFQLGWFESDVDDGCPTRKVSGGYGGVGGVRGEGEGGNNREETTGGGGGCG